MQAINPNHLVLTPLLIYLVSSSYNTSYLTLIRRSCIRPLKILLKIKASLVTTEVSAGAVVKADQFNFIKFSCFQFVSNNGFQPQFYNCNNIILQLIFLVQIFHCAMFEAFQSSLSDVLDERHRCCHKYELEQS